MVLVCLLKDYELMGSSSGIYRILVADSEPMVGTLLRTALSGDGHFVKVVQDGHEARRKLEEDGFSVLILDLKLPGVSALEILQEFRAAGRKAAVILTTTGSKAEAEQACKDFDRVVFLQKPFGLPELRNTLEGVTSKIKF